MSGIKQKGKLLWAGEHWVMYLKKDPSDRRPYSLFNLFKTSYSEHGHGHVAFVDFKSMGGRFPKTFTDNPDLAKMLWRELIENRKHPFNQTFPEIQNAKFTKAGDANSPYWSIQTGTNQILAKWQNPEEPVLMQCRAPLLYEDLDVHAPIIFCKEGTLMMDGDVLPGKSYSQEIWNTALGEEKGSMYYSVAKTFVKI